MSSPRCWPRSQNKLTSIGHATTCSLIISCNSYESHSFTCFPNFGKKTQTTKNTKNWSLFISLSTPRCQSWPWNRIETIGHVSTCCTVIISRNSNITHSRLKIIKMNIFHKFEHSSLPTSLIKQKKNQWESYVTLLWFCAVLTLPTLYPG